MAFLSCFPLEATTHADMPNWNCLYDPSGKPHAQIVAGWDIWLGSQDIQFTPILQFFIELFYVCYYQAGGTFVWFFLPQLLTVWFLVQTPPDRHLNPHTPRQD